MSRCHLLICVTVFISITLLIICPAYAENCSPIQVGLLPLEQIIAKERPVCGVRINLLGGDNAGIRGLDIGLVNISGGVKGLQAGLVNWLDRRSDSNSWGLQAGGLNATKSSFSGLQLGVINAVGKEFAGVQIGISNNGGIDAVKGVQAGIFINNARNVQGAQIVIGGNDVEHDISGIQIGGINISHGIVRGGQIGILNFCGYLTGFQIGLINVVYSHADALPFFPIINIGWH